MLNLKSKASEQQYIKLLNKLMMQIEVKAAKDIAKIILRQYRSAAKKVASGKTGIASSVTSQTTVFINTLEKWYKVTGKRFSDLTWKFFAAEFKSEIKEVKTIEDDFWSTYNVWLKTEAVIEVKNINATTQKVLKRIINNGIKKGESHAVISKKILDSGKIASKTRATTISRTEVHNATTKSINTAIDVTKVIMQKKWLDVGDMRVRDTHINVSGGAWIDKDKDYNVGGTSMERPGDSAGGAENVVNCRCGEMFRRKR